MKKLVFFCFLLLLITGIAVGQTITPIAEIQDTTGTGSDESKMKGETVTISGIISAESWAFENDYYFVQDAHAKWSGIKVYDPGRGTAYGDSVKITGTVDEYNGLTEIKDVTEYTILDSLKSVHPIEVATGDIGTDAADAEAYEGVLLKVGQSEITNPDAGYGQWYIDDGSGEVMVDDEAEYYFNPADYDSVRSLIGILEYSYGDHKLLPRLALDIESGTKYTRIQRFQQVRYSDLLKAPRDAASDTSYMNGDTITVKAIVTMPTGLSYAGDGIKFILEEEEGGPWSAVLSYHEDSTAYPQLFEGDLIEMNAYVGEYSTGPSNMTELWITSPIQVLNWELELPPVDTINTGDLRHPTTAEQWGNVMVAVKDAKVINLEPQYELFSVDDGTGEILIDDDSDSLAGYIDPPKGAVFKSIRGWVYHHYGSYEDSTTYKLEPLYEDDLVLAEGPPMMTTCTREPEVPTAADEVEVTVDVSTNSELESVNLITEKWDFSDPDPENIEFIESNTIAMENTEGNLYAGTIPAADNDEAIIYYVVATDTADRFSTMPKDTATSKYGYVIREEGLKISDIQFSPFTIKKSLYNGYNVEVSGVVTVDTTFNNHYEAYVMQDGAGAWNGVCLFGITEFLNRGDEIKVYGQVHENNPAWTYKWGNNTVILTDSFEVLSEGNSLPGPVELTTAELSNDSEDAEKYESSLVKVTDAEVTSVNSYDWSIDDGSGSCLLDDDAAGSPLLSWFDTLAVGNTISKAQGPFIFSFGTYKITPRDLADVGVGVAVENNNNLAYSYKLKQNYPNPFNPTTHVAFQIPETKRVNISIYNILGQKVRTLASRKFTPGSHVMIWNGKNENGATVPSGAYFLRMEAGDFTSVKKMLFLK
jgi:hypothetical protein